MIQVLELTNQWVNNKGMRGWGEGNTEELEVNTTWSESSTPNPKACTTHASETSHIKDRNITSLIYLQISWRMVRASFTEDSSNVTLHHDSQEMGCLDMGHFFLD